MLCYRATEFPSWRKGARTSEMVRHIVEYRNRYSALGREDVRWIQNEYSDRARAAFLFQVNWIEEEGFATLAETESAVLQGLSGLAGCSDKRLEQTSCLNGALSHFWSEPESTLSVDKIQELHRILMGLAHPEIAGRLRSSPDKDVAFCHTSGGEPHVFVWPDMVATALESLVANYNSTLQELQGRQGDQTEELLKLAASFFFEFEAVHPFVDGNGRIGRVLMAFILRQLLPFPNVLFVDGEQETTGQFVGLDVYFRCFENAQAQQKFDIVNGDYNLTKEAASAGKNEAPVDLAALVIEGVLFSWKRLFEALERHCQKATTAATAKRPTFAWSKTLERHSMAALVHHVSCIVRHGRLEATFLIHDLEHDTSLAIDSSFHGADLQGDPWDFTIVAAAGDLLCLRCRHPGGQRDVLMLCNPQQHAWKRLPSCSVVSHVKRVGIYFDKADYSYRVLAVEISGETVVTEVFDSGLGAWKPATQQDKQFHALLGRCEFDHATGEFHHLVVKKVRSDQYGRYKENDYSVIQYKERLGEWRLVDMNLPARMSESECYTSPAEIEAGYSSRSTRTRVFKASLVGNANGLKLLVNTRTTSGDITSDFEQVDSLVYEYHTIVAKWQTMFLCSSSEEHYRWHKQTSKLKVRWFREAFRCYPAVIGSTGKRNGLRVDSASGSDAESDIGSGERVVPSLLVPWDEHFSTPCKRMPRRKRPRGRGDPRLKPSNEACNLMLDSLENTLRLLSFGHGSKVFWCSQGDTHIVMYDCVTREFRVLHLGEPCILRREEGHKFANWEPVCIDTGVINPDTWKQRGFSVQENELDEDDDAWGDNRFVSGNALLVYDMTFSITSKGRIMVNLMVHDVVEDRSGVVNLSYDARLQYLQCKVEIAAAFSCLLCFRCRHVKLGDVYLVCNPAMNSWQVLPCVPVSRNYMPLSRNYGWSPDETVGMHVDESRVSYQLLVSMGEKTAVFHSETGCWSSENTSETCDISCKFEAKLMVRTFEGAAMEAEVLEVVLGATDHFSCSECLLWAKRGAERVVLYDCVTAKFKILHIVKPWGNYSDGHRRKLRAVEHGKMELCYSHSGAYLRV